MLKEEGLSSEEDILVESIADSILGIRKKESKKYDSSSLTSNETSSSTNYSLKGGFMFTSIQARRQWLGFLRSILQTTFIFDFDKLPPEYVDHYSIILSMCSTLICEFFCGDGNHSISYKIRSIVERKELMSFRGLNLLNLDLILLFNDKLYLYYFCNRYL